MATKTCGNYTAELTKVLKKSERIMCQVTDKGEILITNGFALFTLDLLEYEKFARPAVCCDAGNWELTSSGRKEKDTGLVTIWNRYTNAAGSVSALESCRYHVNHPKGPDLVAYYAAATDTAIFADSFFVDCIGNAYISGTDAKSPVFFSAEVGRRPFALILPVKVPAELERAVKAYFVAPAADQQPRKTAELLELGEKLEAERNAAEQEAAEARAEAEALRKELSALRDQLAAAEMAALRTQQPAEKPAKQVVKSADKPSAKADITDKFTAIPGIICTVKGAQTGAPVVWLAGDVENHVDALKAAGARWSVKRQAWYYKAA